MGHADSLSSACARKTKSGRHTSNSNANNELQQIELQTPMTLGNGRPSAPSHECYLLPSLTECGEICRGETTLRGVAVGADRNASKRMRWDKLKGSSKRGKKKMQNIVLVTVIVPYCLSKTGRLKKTQQDI